MEAQEAEAAPPRPEADPPEESAEAEGPSSFELVSRIVTGLVGAIEDGTELLEATLREELARFREELERRLAGILLLVASAGLLTASAALLLRKVISDWAFVLLILGAVHLAGGVWLMRLVPEGARPGPEEEAESTAKEQPK